MKAELRHKIKEDEFVSLFARVTHHIIVNPRQTYTVIGVAVVLGGLFAGAHYYKKHQDAKANEAFLKALTSFSGTRLDVPPPPGTEPKPDYASALKSFEEAGGYSLSGLKEPARLLAAVSEARMGKAQDAEGRLKNVASTASNVLYARMAKLLLAESLLDQGKAAEAAKAFGEFAQTSDPNFPVEYAMLRLGQAQAKAGDKPAALATFRKIKAQYSDSMFAMEAETEIRRIAPDQAEE